MQAAYFQQDSGHFQPQSPVSAPQIIQPTMMKDDLMVRKLSELQ